MNTCQFACIGVLILITPACRTPAQEPAGFTDVTVRSNLARILDDKYAADPKWWLSGVDLIDLDGDGKLDLFLGAHGGGVAVAALNDGQGHFTVIPPGPNLPTREVYLPADLNADGRIDVLITHEDGAGRWWINRSTPGHVIFENSQLGAGRARANALVDLNADGKIDWLHEYEGGILIESFDSTIQPRAGAAPTAAFSPIGRVTVENPKNETNMIPVDLNGDGHLDLIAHWGRYAYPQGKSRIFLNDGKFNFTDATAAAGLREDGLAIKGVGDLNQDGSIDLLVIENKRPVVYLNDGKAHFTRKDDALLGMDQARKPVYASWGMAVVVDLDNDGIADILWNGRNFLWVLKGLGNGRYQYANKSWGIEDAASATVDDGLCFGDIDDDGALDVIGYSAAKLDGQRRLRVYRNNLAPTATHNGFLNIRLVGAGANRGAAGATIRLTEPGSGVLVAFEPVLNVGSQSAHSYFAYGTTQRHFGLGGRRSVDLVVQFHPSGQQVTRKNVAANQTIELQEPPRQ
ncbi:MAG TPA: CRTAC1 family protein [Tepidisphaeraceae bacterium]|jgi:hypothetical protein